jgi:hypothetical protein
MVAMTSCLKGAAWAAFSLEVSIELLPRSIIWCHACTCSLIHARFHLACSTFGNILGSGAIGTDDGVEEGIYVATEGFTRSLIISVSNQVQRKGQKWHT